MNQVKLENICTIIPQINPCEYAVIRKILVDYKSPDSIVFKKSYFQFQKEYSCRNEVPITESRGSFIESGVLIPLLINNNNVSILYTIRKDTLKQHAGELSFPGGKYDNSMDKTMEDSVKREVYEEIGIKVKQLYKLCEFYSATKYHIHAYFTLYKSTEHFPEIISHDEVDSILLIPMEKLLFSYNHFSAQKPYNTVLRNFYCIDLSNNFEHGYTKNEVFDSKKLIWGITGHITYSLLAFLKFLLNNFCTDDNIS